eukprot:6010817-Alexandrium_andersonii.AAC.1
MRIPFPSRMLRVRELSPIRPCGALRAPARTCGRAHGGASAGRRTQHRRWNGTSTLNAARS